MVLYIGGKSYKDNSSMSEQLKAIKNLPSPLPDVRKDFDEKIYDIQPEGVDFSISKKDGKSDFNDEIIGKSGVIFTKHSKWNNEVYGVGQSEVAFTTGERVGTNNLQDCVALIIRDKDTKKTALAHIHTNQNLQFTSNILSYMPSGDKEVVMVGARHDDTSNVKGILNVLLDYKHDIFIDKSYVFDSSHIYDTTYSLMQSCYDLNTAFGDIIVDTSNLTVSCGNPGRSLPCEKNGIECNRFSYDLDRFATLSSKEDIDKYNRDMDNVKDGHIKSLVTGITEEAVHKGVIHEV